jgi:hypothetical protein
MLTLIDRQNFSKMRKKRNRSDVKLDTDVKICISQVPYGRYYLKKKNVVYIPCRPQFLRLQFVSIYLEA